MVTSKGKLRQLVFYHKIGERVFHGELVSESQTIVVKPESDLHHCGLLSLFFQWLLQGYKELVVMVANVGFLAPYRLPSLIEGAGR